MLKQLVLVVSIHLISLSLLKAADRIELVVGGSSEDAMRLHEPFGVVFDSRSQMWIVEMNSGNRLLKVNAQGMLVHMAGLKGQSGFSGDQGQGIQARFHGPHNLAIQHDDTILIADTWNGRIRKFDPKAGTVDSLPGYEVEISKARQTGPYCITLEATGKRLYVADLSRVLALDLSTHELQVIAGNGKKGIPDDGAVAADAPLVDPRAVEADRLGNIYILERSGNALRVVSADGKIRTVVNRSGKKGNSGDDGPAILATLNGPKHLTIDSQQRVVIADAENHVIRRYDPKSGLIERLAGTGESGSDGLNGDPRKCQLARPHGVTFHPVTGELYITDTYNDRILRISSQSTR